MEQQHLNTGEYAFDPTADDLKEAMEKVENNFGQLFEVAQNLNDQVSPPVILKVTKELHCRPDKEGLYLIDRKQKGDSKAYIQMYNLHFGKVNLKGSRPYGDDDLTFLQGVENEDYHFTDCRLQADTYLSFWTGVITVDPSKPTSVRFTSHINSSISFFITDINDDGEWYEEFHNVQGIDSIWNRDAHTLTLPNGVSSFRIYVYMAAPNSINSLIVRQELDIPEERIKADKRYVLAKWTGTEWVFPTVPNGAEIPIKGKPTYLKTGKLITPAVDFPKLVSTKVGLWKDPSSHYSTPELTLFFIFDRQLDYLDFGYIFSRYKNRKSLKNAESEEFIGPKRGSAYYRYISKYFEIFGVGFTGYGVYRGHNLIGNNEFLTIGSPGAVIVIPNTIILSLSEFKSSFLKFNEDSKGRYTPYNYEHTRKILKMANGNYHIPFGFQLYKTVSGKKVYGELYKVRLNFENGPGITKFSVGK